jgi:AcrR family transcriptional regulator
MASRDGGARAEVSAEASAGAGAEAGAGAGGPGGFTARRGDDTENAILDAAAECVLAYGVRRTSLSDVARRAGVSRPTVYRRWPDLQALVADLMTRELGGVFSAAAAGGAGAPSVRGHAVAQFVAVAAQLRAHPLLTKIIQVDPELLQPYIFDRLGASQRMALSFIAGRIRAGQQDGSIRPGDEAAMSVMVLLTVQSLVFSGRTTDALLTPAARDAEAAVLLNRYLSPEGTQHE